MTVEITRRCASCHQTKPSEEFSAILVVDRKRKSKRVYDLYCNQCKAEGKALQARRLDARDRPPPDR